MKIERSRDCSAHAIGRSPSPWLALVLVVAGCVALAAQSAGVPHLRKHGSATQLIVDVALHYE